MSQNLNAQCHCGGVKFTVELADGFNTVRRCNCSFCRMRGAVVVTATLSGIKIVEGKDLLTEYRFNTQEARHFFALSAEFTRFTNAARIPINTV